jgi:Tfp pilus assembly protein PilV
MTRRARVKDGAGFTLVETMIAMLVLVVGVLGTISLIDASNAASRTTRQREAATNLARQLVEDSRKLSWSSLTPSAITPALQALPGLADSNGTTAGWQINVRGIDFTVTATACSLDDPADGLGVHGGGVTWCAGSAGVADLQPEDYRRVTITVSAPQYSRVGVVTQSDVISLQSVSQADVPSGSGPGAGLALAAAACANCDATAYGLKTISPCSGPGGAFGYGGSCAPAQTTTSISSVGFVANFTGTPASVTWAVDGVKMGSAAGSGTGPWTFTWTLGTTYPQVPVDGKYQITAQAYDSGGVPTGAAASMYVKLDRFAPDAAAFQIVAGRNQQWGANSVDIEAEPTAGVGRVDRDVKQYRVFRCNSTCATYADVPSLAINPAAPSTSTNGTVTAVTEINDPSAPVQAVLKYQIYAVDTDTNGNVSRLGGGPTTSPDVKLANTVPKVAVAPFYAAYCLPGPCTYLGTGPYKNLHWGSPVQPDDADSASGDCIKFWRIYRTAAGAASPTIADRFARTGSGNGSSNVACESANSPPQPVNTNNFGDWDWQGASHKYWIASVDTKMGESAPVLIGTI